VKFGELMKHQRPELVVSPRHDQWMKKNSNPAYSPEAIRFAQEQLYLQGYPRNRKGTISASSLGSCRRRQIFTFLGFTELPPSPKTSGIFQNGTFVHIRWQMAGLTEGWLLAAEVPVGENKYRLSGTQDGIAYDGSIVELKSINSNGFRGVNSFGVKEEHKFQVGTYGAATDNDKAVVIYEDKDTQEYREFVVNIDDELIRDIELITDQIWGLIDSETLPEPLDKCVEGSGYQYSGCPFRDRCLKVKNYNHAKEIAE
jgi:hypothetical protein